MSDFLFELGVEEVPVSEVPSILGQLKSKLETGLKENLVEYKYVETASTHRRFMVYINQINLKANDIEEEVKGPAKRIAFDEQGNATLALKKFLEFNNVSMSDLGEIETKKGVYMALQRKTQGRPTMELLQEMLPKILGGLTFSKTMVWNTSRVPFVRPVKSILALLDGHVVDFGFAGLKSSNTTFGHVLLSDAPVEVNSFKDYCELLTRNFVLVREDERRKKIVDEITDIEDDFNVNIKPDNTMLEDYIYNNEYPVVFNGQFDKKYLELPSEIISTFMISEKKLLPVFDKKNNLTNIFIGVSSIPDENKFVMRGNEKVIRATFEDAKFFWDNDRKENFVALREHLKNVVFHQGLGTFYEKTDRLYTMVEFLAGETGNEALEDSLKKAALYCKNDLVTLMVREFPSLQGIMGGLYLKEAGTGENIWQAAYGHYDPKGFVKQKLEHLGSGLLSLVDKIDNITGFLSKGIKISSSKDPYGIRRDANAIIKIIIDFGLNFDLDKLITLAAGHFAETDEDRAEVIKKTRNLFLGRVENILKDSLKQRYDVVNAILGVEELNIYRMYMRCISVGKIADSESIQHLIALHKRLKNITKKAEKHPVSEEYLVENEEKLLFDIFKETHAKIETSIRENDFMQACSQYLEMKPVIDGFFDKVLVMAEDPNVRRNRLALLLELDALLSEIADFSLVVESK